MKLAIDKEEKELFRFHKCNIVKVKGKKPIVPKGQKILRELQSDAEFEKLLEVKNWAVTQTAESKLLWLDIDTDYTGPLDKCVNRTRQKTEGEKRFYSKHGFIFVKNASHAELVHFVKKLKTTNFDHELYAENHYLIFANGQWQPKDDLAKPVIEITKDELTQVFAEYGPKTTNSIIGRKIPSGKRHVYALALMHKYISKSKDRGDIYREITQDYDFEDLPSFKAELEGIISWCIDNKKDDKIFYFEIIKNFGLHFARLERGDMFNCWYWTGEKWSNRAAEKILDTLQELVPELNPTDAISRTLAAQMSSYTKLQIDDASREYQVARTQKRYDEYGQYFDLQDRQVKAVNPNVDFFVDPDVRIKLDPYAKKPEVYFQYLKDMIEDKDDIPIFDDHHAGGFLHVTNLGSIPRVMYLIGPKDGYKSLIYEIFNESVTSLISESFGKLESNFGKSLFGNKMFNICEENRILSPNDLSIFKDLVSSSGSRAEIKHGKEVVYFHTFPRHTFLGNLVAMISGIDDDESVFKRITYITAKGSLKTNWREKITKKERVRIIMHWLKRASEIYNGSKMAVQDAEVTKERYEILTLGHLKEVIEKFYEITTDNRRCVLIKDFKNNFDTLYKTSFKRIREMVEAHPDLDITASKRTDRVYFLENEGMGTFSTTDEEGKGGYGIQKGVIYGLIPKKQKSEDGSEDDKPKKQKSKDGKNDNLANHT